MRRRFVLVSLAVTTVVAVAFAIPLAVMVRDTARSHAIAGAEREAATIATVLVLTTDPAAVERAVRGLSAGAEGRMLAHLPDGSTVPRRADRTGWASSEARAAVHRDDRPATVPVPGGVAHLRPALLPGNRTALVEVYIPDAVLNRNVLPAWSVLAVLAVILLVAGAVLADRLAAGAVRATRHLADAASRLGDGDLDARVRPSGPPEIATVGTAFNDLANRFRALLTAERELVADLSHRLRTPLTALRLNAEALPSGEERARVLAAAASVEREVDAIIEQARRPLPAGTPARCSLTDVVRERMAFWSALADDQGRRWNVEVPAGDVVVPVGEVEVAAALDAVIGNVFRHTPEGSAYRVAVVAAGGAATVVIDDAGGGIAEPAAALRRGTSSANSTGLGLDIARRVAEATGGEIAVGPSTLGGTRVVLTLRGCVTAVTARRV